MLTSKEQQGNSLPSREGRGGSNKYFISDLHLGAGTLANPLDYERRVVRFLESIEDDCEELFLVGDIIDYWFEYRYVAPRGYTRFLGQLAKMSDKGIKIHWFTGNHDIWIFDYIPQEIGCELHRGPLQIELQGKQMFIAHGDGLGDDSKALKLMTGFFHNRFCQWAFSWIHPDITTKFAHWWSKKSRLDGDDFPEFLGEDKEHLVIYAKKKLQEIKEQGKHIDYFIFGHRHIELDLMMTRDTRLFILGDWIKHFSYAVMDENGRMWMDNFETPLDLINEEHREGVSIAF